MERTHVGGSLAASNCTRIEARNSLNGQRKGQLRLESAGARRPHQTALARKSREQERACSGCKLSNEASAPAGRCLRLSTQASYERCRASAVRLFESLVTACREDDWSVPTR